MPSVREPVRAAGHPAVVASVAAAVGLGCGGLWALSVSPVAHLLHHDGVAAASGVPMPVLVLVPLAGWLLMVIAMMLPTAVQFLAAVATVAAGRSRAGRIVAATAAGFVAVWVAYGGTLLSADMTLHRIVDRTPWLRAHPNLIAAATFGAAGAFQFSRLKDACLTRCRRPQSFLLQHWKGGSRAVSNATRLGAVYGLSCLGCCWGLMLVMFGIGAGSLVLMLLLTAVMSVEKNGRRGDRLTRPIGAALIAAALATALLGRSPV